jgi:hypothetical protein
VADRDYRPNDPIVARAADALRALPAVDRDAIARTIAAAGRARVGDAGPNEDDLVTVPPPRVWSALAIAVAAAVIIVIAGAGTVLWRQTRRPTEATIARVRRPSSTTASNDPVIPASAPADLAESAPILTQFVYDGPARHVSLVGDFNGWDEHATPLEREPGSALWSATVPLQRGRHVYAFIVDSTWTTDRRAPVARDPDFGVEGSVVIVGRP